MLRQTLCRLILPALLGVAATSGAKATSTTITITGTVSSGLDLSGVFVAPNSSLSGQAFTLVYGFDNLKGQQSVQADLGGVYGTSLSGDNAASPGSAMLTINDRSFTFGTYPGKYPATTVTSSATRDVSTSTQLQNQLEEIVTEYYTGVPNSAAESYVDSIVGTVNYDPAITKDPNWSDSLTHVLNSREQYASVGSGFLIRDETNLPAYTFAYGSLLENTITVTGPSVVSSAPEPANVWVAGLALLVLLIYVKCSRHAPACSLGVRRDSSPVAELSTTKNYDSYVPRIVVAAALLLATVLPASAQLWGIGGNGRSRARQVYPVTTAAQTTPASTGISDVKWEGNTIRLANSRPTIIYEGTDPVKPTTRAIAAISGSNVVAMPGANIDAAQLQKSLDNYFAMQARGGSTVTQPAATMGSGVDQVTWQSGEPGVRLSDGYEVAFSGGSGSKIKIVSPGGVQTVEMEFTAAVHGAGGMLKALATTIGSIGSNTAALKGGAWKASTDSRRFFDQDLGAYRDVVPRPPGWLVEAIQEVFRAQHSVIADPRGKNYKFTGVGKLQELGGPPRASLPHGGGKAFGTSTLAAGLTPGYKRIYKSHFDV